MRKLLYSIPHLVRPIMFVFALWGVLFAQDESNLSKEDEKFWKKKANDYVKHPEVLQGEFETFKDSIKYWKSLNKNIEMTGEDAALWREVDSLQRRIIELENELRSQIKENLEIEGAGKSVSLVNDLGIKTGLVYRVMFNDANRQAETARTFDKFVVGGFRTLKEAKNFQTVMKSLGLIGETTIVPYMDGIKVEGEEAEKLQQQKRAGK